MKAKLFVSIACGVALVCGSASAQPGGFGGGMGGGMPMGGGFPGMMMGAGGAVDMTSLAEFQAEQLARELNLTEKQQKKVAKINKKELDRRMNHYIGSGAGSSGGFGGFRGGMPGGGPGGMPGGGMPGGGRMGGGFPGGGFPGMGEADDNAQAESNESAELRNARAAYSRLEAMEETKADLKAQIKIEKKMKKILTEEQYDKWSHMSGRIGRPRGPQPMPEAEFNFENIPEEMREQMIERMRQGGFREGPPGGPQDVPMNFPQNFAF